jgi:Uma2 family endonuclease
MATTLRSQPLTTVADLLNRLGGISPRRVRFTPVPGTATEKDLLAAADHEDRLFELVDGTLVEKAVGLRESFLTFALGRILGTFVKAHKLGLLTGPDGALRLFRGIVRAPDIAFVSWKKLPNRKVPSEPIPHLAPDLAIEVLSKGNTKKEMARKRREYFKAGVQLVWEIDPVKRQAVVYTSPKEGKVIDEGQALTGDDVLPGFSLPLADLFAELDD